MSAGNPDLPGTGLPIPRRKKNAFPWKKCITFVAAMTVVGVGVWQLVLKAIPILSEKGEEKSAPPVSAHESQEFNYRLVIPKSPWTQDNEVRLQLKANVLVMRRTEPTAWFALAARDYKTRVPRDSEVLEEAVSRLSGYFKNLEWEQAAGDTLAGRKALRLIFQGNVGDSTMNGECLILIYQGIAYWFTTWAPFGEIPQVANEFRQIREGFSLVNEREGSVRP
jgi:hypothetical protein